MAKLEGGIFSRPRGKTGGVVFGAARTRNGKVVTSRLLVAPSNPRTAAQVSQRNIFSNALFIVRTLGASIYQSDWNRAIAQLPGFQGMMSIFMNNMDDQFILTAPAETNLGVLHVPDQFSAGPGAAGGEFDLTWSTEIAGQASAADTAVILAIDNGASGVGENRIVQVDTSAIRTDGAITIDMGDAGSEPIFALYFRGEVGAITEGLISNALWRLGV